MPRVEARVSESEKAAWLRLCEARGRKEANLLREIIRTVTNVDENESIPYRPGKSNQVNVRLSDLNLELLDRRAESEGYSNRTAWATAVLLAALNQEPVLTDKEVDALRESNRELRAIGKNLNQITRVLNIEFRESDKLKREAIEKLDERIEQHKDLVAALLARNMNRWSDDG